MFCVECGRKTDKLYNGLCIDCYLKNKKFFKFPKKIIVKKCKNCGAYRIGNEWKHGNLEKLLEKYIENIIKKEIECKFYINFDKRKIKCVGNFEGKEIIEEGEFKIEIKKGLCDKCSLIKGGYFEAILQIRKKNLDKKMEEQIEEIINKKIEEANSFILKKERKQEGIDYYIGSKKVAHAIAKEIKNYFKGEPKSSSSLVGMKNGMEIYRDTYLVRIPEYEIGSFIKLGNGIYKIIGIGKKLEIVSLGGERKYIYKNELKKAKLLELKEREAIILHEEKNGIYIMDPLTYKTYFVKKPKKLKNKIKIIEYEGKIYVIE